MLHLEKLNHKNIWDIVDLKVFKLQKDFVAPNWASIIEAYSILDTETAAFPFGIYNDKKPVGFLMIGFNESDADRDFEEGHEPPKVYDNNYTIWRRLKTKLPESCISPWDLKKLVRWMVMKSLRP